MKTPQVFATSVESNARSVPRRHESSYSPVVSSMLKANTMRNCVEVKDMYAECLAEGNDRSYMCRTAEKYHDMCVQGHRL